MHNKRLGGESKGRRNNNLVCVVWRRRAHLHDDGGQESQSKAHGPKDTCSARDGSRIAGVVHVENRRNNTDEHANKNCSRAPELKQPIRDANKQTNEALINTVRKEKVKSARGSGAHPSREIESI